VRGKWFGLWRRLATEEHIGTEAEAKQVRVGFVWFFRWFELFGVVSGSCSPEECETLAFAVSFFPLLFLVLVERRDSGTSQSYTVHTEWRDCGGEGVVL